MSHSETLEKIEKKESIKQMGKSISSMWSFLDNGIGLHDATTVINQDERNSSHEVCVRM